MQLPDFHKLFERLPSPYMVLDRDLNYVAVNTAYEQAVLRSREEMIGRNIFELFPNEGEEGVRLRESFQRVLATGQSDTLAHIAYDIPSPERGEGAMETRYWTAVHTALPGSDGKVAYVIQNTVDVTEVVKLREAASLPFAMTSGATQLIERAREADNARRSLMAESSEFRRMFQQAPGFIAVLMGPDHIFTFCNDAYTRLIGGRKVVGMDVAAALPEVREQGFIDMLDRVYASGRSEGGQAMRILLQQEAGQAPNERFLDFSYDAIKDQSGAVTGVFVQGMDRTETVRTLRYQRLLLDELNHRVKNTLATVQSIASQTLRATSDPVLARKAFEARIKALSNAHDLLSARKWDNADLSDIVQQELAAHGEGRITREGPPVMLNPKAAIGLSMVVHELATNAAKYGALSAPGGRLAVQWDADDSGDLQIGWLESKGPEVTPPNHRGFGSRMIERVVVAELGGDYSCAHRPEGFTCRFRIPAESYGKTAHAPEY